MDANELKQRTKAFALRTIRLCASLPRTRVGDVVGRQLLRAGTSVGANYRAACKARSASEFAAKIAIVEEEADECMYWMELIEESGIVAASKLRNLHKEASEIAAIAAASRKTARLRLGNNARTSQSAIGNRQLAIPSTTPS